MSVKDNKSEVFSYVKKVKCEFLARSHTFSLNKWLFEHSFAFVLMQMCACLKEHMRKVIDYVFCALCIVCCWLESSRLQ